MHSGGGDFQHYVMDLMMATLGWVQGLMHGTLLAGPAKTLPPATATATKAGASILSGLGAAKVAATAAGAGVGVGVGQSAGAAAAGQPGRGRSQTREATCTYNSLAPTPKIVCGSRLE